MTAVRDITFVVRCAGERTAPAAVALLREQVAALGGDPKQQVIPVAERPFVEAVRATMDIGVDCRRPWTVGMDADVLLLNDGVQRLMSLCTAAPADTFTITSLVLCRFFGGFCFRGIHAYPTRHLPEALGLIDSSGAAHSLRPETCVVNAMMELRGLKMVGPPVPIGVHDFEQSFRHIYLKMRLRAKRELLDEPGKLVTDYMKAVDARAKAGEAEALVASWGLEHGRDDAVSGSGPVHYDWDAKYAEFDGLLAQHKLPERSALTHAAARGYADAVVSRHDFAADVRTPKWIRDKHAFAGGYVAAGRSMGLALANVA